VALLALALLLWLAQRSIAWTALQSAPWTRAGLLAAVIGGAAAAYFAALFALGFRVRDFRLQRTP
jgi:putative peptidoglycan lipid II flippase